MSKVWRILVIPDRWVKLRRTVSFIRCGQYSIEARFSQRAVTASQFIFSTSAAFLHEKRASGLRIRRCSKKIAIFTNKLLRSKKCVLRRLNVVINSNELHCFTKEEGLEYMSISAVTASSRCEALSDQTTVTSSLWSPAMGILTSSNVPSVFTSSLARAATDRTLLLLS